MRKLLIKEFTMLNLLLSPVFFVSAFLFACTKALSHQSYVSVFSVIFQSDVVGEFWYALKLTVEKPLPTDLPEIVCELGK